MFPIFPTKISSFYTSLAAILIVHKVSWCIKGTQEWEFFGSDFESSESRNEFRLVSDWAEHIR